MPRTFVVDAHNALFRLLDPTPTSGDAVRAAVVSRAKTALARRGEAGARVHLIFDTARLGKHNAGKHGKDGAVSWSYADGSADDEIVRLIREHEGLRDGTAIAVVTDDRELRGRAAQLGAVVLHVRDWFVPESTDERPPAPKTGPPMTAADFGFTKDAVDLFDDPDDV